jgi:hypothetical protein
LFFYPPPLDVPLLAVWRGAGIGASVFLADLVYNVPANIIIDSCR